MGLGKVALHGERVGGGVVGEGGWRRRCTVVSMRRTVVRRAGRYVRGAAEGCGVGMSALAIFQDHTETGVRL